MDPEHSHGWREHPARFHNLLSTPELRVELGIERIRLHVVVAEGMERDLLGNRHAELVPEIVEYQARPCDRSQSLD